MLSKKRAALASPTYPKPSTTIFMYILTILRYTIAVKSFSYKKPVLLTGVISYKKADIETYM